MKIRITLDSEVWNPDEKNKKKWIFSDAKTLVEAIKPYVQTRCSAGLEFRSKVGDWCKPHIHIHMDTDTLRNTIVKKLKRVWNDLNDNEVPFKAKTVYTCVFEHSVKEELFFRYVWKQYDSIDAIHKHGLYHQGTEDLMVEHHPVAHQVWLESRQYNIVKADKYLESTTTIYQRICQALEAEAPKTLAAIIKIIINLYVKEEKPINSNTITGYAINYALKINIISLDDYAKKLADRSGI